MNENLYIAHKKLPHKTLRVHSNGQTKGGVNTKKYKAHCSHLQIPMRNVHGMQVINGLHNVSDD